MNSYQKNRLIAALLLFLAAFGIARFPVPAAGSEQSVVCSARQRQVLRLKSEAAAPKSGERRIAYAPAVRTRLPRRIVCRSLFQRPPPFSSLQA